jgi:putative colanic acid biosynthesis UDP-glucose lipid carrier transferase
MQDHNEPLRWSALVQFGLVTSFFAYLCMRHFGLYDTERVRDLPVSPARIVCAIVCAFAVAFGLAIPFGINEAGFWLWYAVWAVIGATLIVINRLIARSILRRIATNGAFDRRIAIYGSGSLADRLSTILSSKVDGVTLVGVFDERRTADRSVSANAAVSVCGLDDLVARSRAGEIDQIIIALPADAGHRTSDIARRLEPLSPSLHVCTHIEDDLVDPGCALSVSRVGTIGLLDINRKPLGDWGVIVKAVEDFVLGAVALVVFLPVMALIAIAIKLDSRGPALFRQRRHGLNRRVIEVLKFRTMYVQENGHEVRQATRGDPRVTRVGRFLRSTSLDELPQLFNVLRGEMSLVGPRPHALVHDDHYGEMLERYANRHRVKPGMTGLAQVEGYRGPTETDEMMRGRVERDLHYIDNWSLWLDLHIMAKTVVLGFRHKNAL